MPLPGSVRYVRLPLAEAKVERPGFRLERHDLASLRNIIYLRVYTSLRDRGWIWSFGPRR